MPVATATASTVCIRAGQHRVRLAPDVRWQRRTRAANVAAVAERLPSVFNADKPLPLAIRTDKAVREALALPWSQGNELLHWWTHRPAYYQALIAGGPRYNLDGTADGEVTPHQQAHATKALRRHQHWLAGTTTQAGETKEGAPTV